MRILLDESIPRKFGFALQAHHVRTVQFMGWSGLVNGALLSVASAEFDVLITGDQNMQYQQSTHLLPISVVVLITPNNKLESLLPLLGKLIDILNNPIHLQTPQFIRLELDT
jgi:predicted nuclease of predicted toxin-antitoxin system